jgi:hypothetical protein
MRRDDANPGGARLGMEARESLRSYDDKTLKATSPAEREEIDYDRHQLGKEPVDWKRIDAPPAKKTGGIGPERSISTAEKRGKEYGYARKVSFYQCKNVDQANEINTQLAELSDETELVLDRVYVYKGGGKAKEAPKNSLGYQQHRGEGDTSVIGLRDGCTAAYCRTLGYDKAEQQSEYDRYLAKANAGGPSSDFYKQAADETFETLGYESYTYMGNGVRNPVVDHEFAHALVSRAHVSRPSRENYDSGNIRVDEKGYPIYWLNDVTAGKLNNLGDRCREFNIEKKISVYGSHNARTSLFIKSEEPLAETYAYWKAGGQVTPAIESGFKRLEAFRRPTK